MISFLDFDEFWTDLDSLLMASSSSKSSKNPIGEIEEIEEEMNRLRNIEKTINEVSQGNFSNKSNHQTKNSINLLPPPPPPYTEPKIAHSSKNVQSSESSELAKFLQESPSDNGLIFPSGIEVLSREIFKTCSISAITLLRPGDICKEATERGYFTVGELLTLKKKLVARYKGEREDIFMPPPNRSKVSKNIGKNEETEPTRVKKGVKRSKSCGDKWEKVMVGNCSSSTITSPIHKNEVGNLVKESLKVLEESAEAPAAQINYYENNVGETQNFTETGGGEGSYHNNTNNNAQQYGVVESSSNLVENPISSGPGPSSTLCNYGTGNYGSNTNWNYNNSSYHNYNHQSPVDMRRDYFNNNETNAVPLQPQPPPYRTLTYVLKLIQIGNYFFRSFYDINPNRVKLIFNTETKIPRTNIFEAHLRHITYECELPLFRPFHTTLQPLRKILTIDYTFDQIRNVYFGTDRILIRVEGAPVLTVSYETLNYCYDSNENTLQLTPQDNYLLEQIEKGTLRLNPCHHLFFVNERFLDCVETQFREHYKLSRVIQTDLTGFYNFGNSFGNSSSNS